MSLNIRKKCFDEFIQTESRKEFLPERKLLEILPDAAIEQCIRECDFEDPWIRDYTATVKAGGRKVLLILVLIREVKLIAKFVENRRAHDSCLPFNQSDLNEILRDKAAVSDFYIRQWSIIPAFFSEGDTHRVYHEDTIFPFLGPTQRLPGGAFGEVAIVTLANTQHQFPDMQRERGSLRVVRKLLKSEGESDSSSNSNTRPPVFRNEERILRLLRELKHPNIIQLLASYTIKKDSPEHHFLFPCAECDLSKALQSESKDFWNSMFPSHDALFYQIYGLSCAIADLHEYIGQDGLKQIGCHYDLKPQNILINDGRLLLG